MRHQAYDVSIPSDELPAQDLATSSRHSRVTRQVITFIARALFSASLLWLAFPKLSLGDLKYHLQTLDLRLLALPPMLLLTMSLLSALRWQRISAVVACPFAWIDAWRVTMSAVFFEQLIFNLSGDALRIWWLNGRAPSATRSVASVLLDRLIGVLALIVLVLAAMPFLAAAPSIGSLIWIPLILSAGGLGGTAVILAFRSLPLPRFPFSENLSLLSAASRDVLLNRCHLLNTLGPALLVQAGWPCIIAAIGASVGAKTSLGWCFLIVPTVMFITMLPISVGGWGVRETAMAVGLGAAGVSHVDAVLISVLAGLCTAGFGLLGAVIWLLGLPLSDPAIQLTKIGDATDGFRAQME